MTWLAVPTGLFALSAFYLVKENHPLGWFNAFWSFIGGLGALLAGALARWV